MKIFYHNDMDGKCATHVVLWLDSDAEPGTCTIPMQYGMEFPFEHIGKDETVYILDFSIELEDMTKLLEITEAVVWIDHHKTAIEKYQSFEWRDENGYICSVYDIDGNRQDDAAGCVLTYYHFRPFQHSKTRKPDYEPIPEYILLIGDRDIWRWEFGDRTKHFYAGLEAHDTRPGARIWTALSESQESANALVHRGEIIQEYKDRTQQDYILENGFWVAFHGYRCYAVNGLYSSQPFAAVVPDADIWLTFRYDKGGYWTVSLYSTKVDVSEIAKEYEYHGKKGGGHKGAAGFQCAYTPFLPNKETT